MPRAADPGLALCPGLTHWLCCLGLRQLQNALHRSGPFVHAVSIHRGLRIAPAKRPPNRRSDSRRGNDSDSDFEKLVE
jgi:hypothetical protein